MAAQQGFEYEKNTAKFLKKFNLVPKNFVPAGASHDQPDLLVAHRGKEAGVELKLSAASAGSLVLKYTGSDKHSPWHFNKIERNEKEKFFLSGIADEIDLFSLIKKEWKEVPYKRDKDETWEATAGKLSEQERYKRDLEYFPDIIREVPAQKIERYYNTKDTFYVNVGTHGFYTFGNKDPLQLNVNLRRAGGTRLVPAFGVCAKATARTRVQYKGGGAYQFTFELQFRIIRPSPYNIAPIVGHSPVIAIRKANLSCFR